MSAETTTNLLPSLPPISSSSYQISTSFLDPTETSFLENDREDYLDQLKQQAESDRLQHKNSLLNTRDTPSSDSNVIASSTHSTTSNNQPQPQPQPAQAPLSQPSYAQQLQSTPSQPSYVQQLQSTLSQPSYAQQLQSKTINNSVFRRDESRHNPNLNRDNTIGSFSEIKVESAKNANNTTATTAATTRFAFDIQELQSSLKQFTNMKASNIKFHQNQVNTLFLKYRCRGIQENGIPPLVLSGALQRLIIETIFEETAKYINHDSRRSKLLLPAPSSTSKDNSHHNTLETEIINTTNNLILLTTLLSENFEKANKSDSNSKAPVTNYTSNSLVRNLPNLIRQQTASALREAAFSNDQHSFLQSTSKKVIDTLNLYRDIKTDAVVLKREAIDVVKKVVRVLWFGIRAQEKVPELIFFEAGDELDVDLMNGEFDEDDLDTDEVEICSFPLIAIDPTDDENRTVIAKSLIKKRPIKTNRGVSRHSVASESYTSSIGMSNKYSFNYSNV